MGLFRKKQLPNLSSRKKGRRRASFIELDPSILRKNDITRLTIDERWTKLFVNIKMTPEIEKAEKEMNELIKEEAMLKKEQESLEPQKRRLMNEILNLTRDAFENNNDAAKDRLQECKKEIERINARINEITEDVEKINDRLKKANLELLNNSVNYIFATLKSQNEKALKIKNELKEIEKRKNELMTELETIKVDWTQYAVDLTNLIGADPVKQFEEAYKLEGLKDETVDASADESYR